MGTRGWPWHTHITVGYAVAVTNERLQKLLAGAGHGSRRGIEEWIRAGRVTINGRPAALGDRATHGDQICLDGRPLDLTGSAASTDQRKSSMSTVESSAVSLVSQIATRRVMISPPTTLPDVVSQPVPPPDICCGLPQEPAIVSNPVPGMNAVPVHDVC